MLGNLDTDTVSTSIVRAASEISKLEVVGKPKIEVAQSVLISSEAYKSLQKALPGVSDEHSFQLLAEYLRNKQ